jgi:hypothetical protein
MDWHPKFWCEDDLREWLSPEEKELIEDGLEEHASELLESHPCEFFAGNEQPHVINFIRFCRLASFVVL